MKFIKEHKMGIIVGVVCLILMVVLFLTVYSMFNPSNLKDIYGSRLDGEVTVSDSEVEAVKSKLNESGIINSITYNKNVRIIKFIINVKDDTKVEDAQKVCNTILETFSKEILEYYDVEVYVTSNLESYPMIGYHSKNADAFTWTINRGEVSE